MKLVAFMVKMNGKMIILNEGIYLMTKLSGVNLETSIKLFLSY